jgi:hypothetical protein
MPTEDKLHDIRNQDPGANFYPTAHHNEIFVLKKLLSTPASAGLQVCIVSMPVCLRKSHVAEELAYPTSLQQGFNSRPKGI